MKKALERCTPDGEAMLAGIHVITKEFFVSCAFEECAITEDILLNNIGKCFPLDAIESCKMKNFFVVL